MPRTTMPLSPGRWAHIKSLRVVPRWFHQGGTYVRPDTAALQKLLGRKSVKHATTAEIIAAAQRYKGKDKDILLLQRRLDEVALR
jgi:hypothetical protein